VTLTAGRRRHWCVPGQVWADERQSDGWRRPGGLVWISARVILLIIGGHTRHYMNTYCKFVGLTMGLSAAVLHAKFDSSQTKTCMWSIFQSARIIVAHLVVLHSVCENTVNHRHRGGWSRKPPPPTELQYPGSITTLLLSTVIFTLLLSNRFLCILNDLNNNVMIAYQLVF